MEWQPKLLLILVLVLVPYWFLKWYEEKQKNTWKLVEEGEYEHSETRTSLIKAGRLSKPMLFTATTIFFKDGKTCPIRGVLFKPPEPGTKIKILRNGLGESRIETA